MGGGRGINGGFLVVYFFSFLLKTTSLSASNQVIDVVWQHLCSILGSFIRISHLDTVLPWLPCIYIYSGSRLLCQYWISISHCPSFISLLEYLECYVICIELQSS